MKPLDLPYGGDQVPRKLRYEQTHPEVKITCGFGGLWRARVPGQDAEIVRVVLRHLLDALDALDALDDEK